MRRPLIVLGLSLLAAGLLVPAVPGAPTVPVAAASGTLEQQVRRAVARTQHATFDVSLGVWNAETGALLASIDANTPRRTASSMKLATTAAALLALGDAGELVTEVRTADEPEDGAVRGDLVVIGGGDPGFSEHLAGDDAVESAVAGLAREVRRRGIRRVSGDLVLDISAFVGDERHPGWGWEPGDWSYYMAPVTALTIMDGCVDVSVLPGSTVGAPARVSVAPSNGLIRVDNRLVTTAEKKQHSIHFGRLRADGRLDARGRVWNRSTGYTASLACIDPAVLFGDVFRRALRAAGVEVSGETRVERTAGAKPDVLLARHATRVQDAVHVTNRRSHNLYSELLLRAVALRLGQPGSFEGGCAAVRETLRFADDDRDFVQEDGSGLSRGNRATPTALGRILIGMYASDHRLEFMGSLARAGEQGGTLSKRLRADRLENRVLGKTGTLRDTSALAGYVLTEDDRVLAYAILCEGIVWRSRALQDAVVTTLADIGR